MAIKQKEYPDISMWVLEQLWITSGKQVDKEFAYDDVCKVLETDNPYNLSDKGVRNVKGWLGHPERNFIVLSETRTNGNVMVRVTQKGVDALASRLAAK